MRRISTRKIKTNVRKPVRQNYGSTVFIVITTLFNVGCVLFGILLFIMSVVFCLEYYYL